MLRRKIIIKMFDEIVEIYCEKDIKTLGKEKSFLIDRNCNGDKKDRLKKLIRENKVNNVKDLMKLVDAESNAVVNYIKDARNAKQDLLNIGRK